jgi:hypothetical protein
MNLEIFLNPSLVRIGVLLCPLCHGRISTSTIHRLDLDALVNHKDKELQQATAKMNAKMTWMKQLARSHGHVFTLGLPLCGPLTLDGDKTA